jgi:hypothetical protein
MHAEDARERHRDDREDEADDEPFSTGSEMNEARKPQPDEAATKPQTPVTIASAMVSCATSALLRAAMSAAAPDRAAIAGEPGTLGSQPAT